MTPKHLISYLATPVEDSADLPAGAVVLDYVDGVRACMATAADLGAGRILAGIVDCETLGLDLADPVIEIALQLVLIDTATGEVRLAGDRLQPLSGRQDPGRPVPPEITRITGLTNEDVRGCAAPWGSVASLFAVVDLVIAHNAGFDRPRVEGAVQKHAPEAWRRMLEDRAERNKGPLLWACTQRQVDWQARGAHRNTSLEPLCWQHGFWFSPHRAEADVVAVAELLRRSSVGVELWRRANQPSWRIEATKTPYNAREALKRSGYRWEPRTKTWWVEVETETDAAKEMDFVVGLHGRAHMKLIEPHNRFLP